MINTKYSSISILLIMAILFSLIGVMIPATPAQAIGTTAVISAVSGNNNPSNTGPACVSSISSGSVQVTFADSVSEYCQVFMQQGSNTAIAGQAGTPAAATPTTYTINAAGATAGYYNVFVMAGGTSSAVATNTVYIDNSAPVVSISTANLCWPINTQETINWSATIPSGIASENFSTITLTWNNVGFKTYTNQGQTTNGSFPYMSPGATTSGTLGITATSNAGTTVSYTFATQVNVLAAGYIYPSGLAVSGTTLACGSAATITCNVINTASPNYYYNLTLNTGTSTINITPGWVLATSASGISYPWTVSSVNSSSCSVTIGLKDCAGNLSPTLTSSTFAITCITPPTVTITAPLSGTVWYSGSSDNITWLVSDPLSTAAHTCTVWYSLNDNTTNSWTQIVLPVYNSGTSYWVTWAIPPAIASTNCEIYVTAQAGAGPVGTGYGSIFTINQITVAPTVTVVSPASTSNWTAGTTQTIGWTVSGTPTNTLMDYKIYLVSGGSILSTIASQIGQAQCPSTACTYTWNIPTALTAGAYTIRVVASYMVGPGPQEQMFGQADSALFNIQPTTAPCNYTTQIVPLHPYWNLISLQTMPASSDINTVLADVMPDVLSVWYFTGGNSGTWQNYIPAAGAGTLTSISDGHAYWVQMSGTFAGSQFTYQGRPCPCGGTTPLQAYVYPSAWSMVGFKSTIPQPVNTYMYGSCGYQYSSPIQGLDGASQSYVSLNCSENMTPGMGYWIYFGVATGVSAGCK
jgi:hypothetical protein